MRKKTVFDLCPAHEGWTTQYGRYRTAEIVCEGGPAYGPPCSPRLCRVLPGSDLFAVSATDAVAADWVRTWGVNTPTSVPGRAEDLQAAPIDHPARPILIDSAATVTELERTVRHFFRDPNMRVDPTTLDIIDAAGTPTRGKTGRLQVRHAHGHYRFEVLSNGETVTACDRP